LPITPLRRTLASTMSSGFDTPFARVKALLRRLPLGEILSGRIDTRVYGLYALTPAEIQIVEGHDNT
jgi:hypothetical protein